MKKITVDSHMWGCAENNDTKQADENGWMGGWQ